MQTTLLHDIAFFAKKLTPESQRHEELLARLDRISAQREVAIMRRLKPRDEFDLTLLSSCDYDLQ